MASIILLLCSLSFASISFQDAVLSISNQDPQFKGQFEKVEYQKQLGLSSALSFLPTLDLSYTQEKNLDTEIEAYSSSVILNANLFKGGSDFYNFRTQYQLLGSEKELFTSKEIESLKNSYTLVISYILSSKKLKIVEELLKIQKNSLEIANKRFERGLIPSQEKEKAEVDVYNSEARLMNAQIEFEKYKRSLDSYLGEKTFLAEWPYSKDLLSGRKKLAIDNSETRYDLKALNSYVNAMENSHLSRFGAFIPRVDLSYRHTNSALESGFFDKQGADSKVLSLNFTWSLFNGFRDRANLAQSRYLLEEAKHRLTDLERETKALQISEMNNFKMAVESLQRRKKTLEISRKIYRQSVRRFQDGKLSFNDLEIDQNRYLETELLAQEGEAQVHLKLADICLVYGKSVLNCVGN